MRAESVQDRSDDQRIQVRQDGIHIDLSGYHLSRFTRFQELHAECPQGRAQGVEASDERASRFEGHLYSRSEVSPIDVQRLNHSVLVIAATGKSILADVETIMKIMDQEFEAS